MMSGPVLRRKGGRRLAERAVLARFCRFLRHGVLFALFGLPGALAADEYRLAPGDVLRVMVLGVCGRSAPSRCCNWLVSSSLAASNAFPEATQYAGARPPMRE